MKYIHNEVWGATIRIEYSHLFQDKAGFAEASASGISNVVFADEESSSQFEDELNSHPNHLKLMLPSSQIGGQWEEEIIVHLYLLR